MYPFKFNPILKSTIWGGEKIIPYKELECSQGCVGESWELSGVKGCESVVANGELAGMTLSELIDREGARLMGKTNYERFGDEFPLLIKFIDARQDLSIQVHPDDRLARMRHNSMGKTEMWYVVAADEGAHLRSGFCRKVNAGEYVASVENNTITDLLADHEVKPGDVFFLPAGRIHSIGAGAFIAEIQQTSDITYRIYDFCRRDADGNMRELHTELAKDAISYDVEEDYRTHYAEVENDAVELVSCPYFTTSLYVLTRDKRIDLSGLDSFVVLIAMEGRAVLTDDAGNSVTLHQGETVLLAAATAWVEIVPESRFKLLAGHVG